MKKSIIIALLLFAGLGFTFTSCGKYVDGPKFSLLTKKARVVNTWTIEQVLYTPSGGSQSDITSSTLSALGDNTYDIKKDGTYSTADNFGTDTGTWELGEDKDDLLTTSSATGSTQESARILKLKSKEMWLKTTASNGDITEVHYKQK